VNSGRQGDKHAEMKVAQLFQPELLIAIDFPEYLAGLEPNVFRWSEYWK